MLNYLNNNNKHNELLTIVFLSFPTSLAYLQQHLFMSSQILIVLSRIVSANLIMHPVFSEKNGDSKPREYVYRLMMKMIYISFSIIHTIL